MAAKAAKITRASASAVTTASSGASSTLMASIHLDGELHWTIDIGMNHLSFLGGLPSLRQIIGLKDLLKCLRGLFLQLIVDEVLERLSRDSLDFVALSFLVSLRAALHTFIFHLLIVRDCSSHADLRHVAA